MTEAKTETTLELIEAARWCGFKAAEGWPQQFTPGQVARLQHWHEKDIKARTANLSAWVDWLKVATGSNRGKLIVSRDGQTMSLKTLQNWFPELKKLL